jgi:hypothetical protein
MEYSKTYLNRFLDLQKPETMPDQSPRTIVGCLLDVSGSMRSALEVGRDNHEPATDRFHTVLSAALMFVGAFGLFEEEPAVADLCGIVEALVGEEKDKGKSGHDLLIQIANEKGLEHISRYIRTKLADDEARMVYVHLGLHPEKTQEFVEAIPPPHTLLRQVLLVTALGRSLENTSRTTRSTNRKPYDLLSTSAKNGCKLLENWSCVG